MTKELDSSLEGKFADVVRKTLSEEFAALTRAEAGAGVGEVLAAKSDSEVRDDT
jgi:hypothetical protein